MIKNLILCLLIVPWVASTRILNFQSTQTTIKLTDEVDYTFDYELFSDTNNSTGMDYAPFLFGTHNNHTNEGNPVKLHVSTALKQISVAGGKLAAQEKDPWGFNCTSIDLDGCKLDAVEKDYTNAQCSNELKEYTVFNTETNGQIQYFDKTQTECRSASTFMRWTNSTLDDAKNMTNNLQIQFFQQDPLVGVKAGLLGLMPSGDFFTYIQTMTDWGTSKEDKDPSVTFGLSLTPNSGADQLVDGADIGKWKQNQFVIHGKRNGGDIKFFNTIIDESSWTIPFANLTIADAGNSTTYEPKANSNLCVSSEYPFMVGFKNATKSTQLLKYFNNVCKDGDATNCKEADATKGNVSKVTINIDSGNDKTKDDFMTYALSIDTADILWFKKDSTLFSIVGQHVTPDDLVKYGCSGDSDMIVGRPFLSKYEAVMSVTKTEKKLGFIANEGTSSIFLIILIILGCIILAICIAIILLKVCKRKGNDEGDDGYQKQN